MFLEYCVFLDVPICHGRKLGCELIVCRSECLFELSGIDCNWSPGAAVAGAPPPRAFAKAAGSSTAFGCTGGIGGTTMPGRTGGAPGETPPLREGQP
jgi:hypothetical protein